MTIQGSEDPLLEIDHTGASGHPAIWFKQDGSPKAYMWWDRVNNSLRFGTPAANPILSLMNNGNVGIGTTNPASKLEIAAQDGLAIIGYQPFLTLRDTNAGGRAEHTWRVGTATLVFIPTASSAAARRCSSRSPAATSASAQQTRKPGSMSSGQTRTRALQITGGADFAENFESMSRRRAATR